MPLPAVSPFVIIPLVLVGLLAWGAEIAWRRSGASAARARRVAVQTLLLAAGWMALTWILASGGAFLDFERTPPPLALLVLSVVALAAILAFSRFGARLAAFLPLWALVGVQSFRLPLELAMHGMYEAGVMPVQMSYSGRNFDIVTGITAVVVAALLYWNAAGRATALIWNLLGLGLLINVVVVAILGTPRFQYFGREHLNVWVLHPPFVWLPAVMVLAALAGHLLIFRAVFSAATPAGAAPPRSRRPPGRTTRA